MNTTRMNMILAAPFCLLSIHCGTPDTPQNAPLISASPTIVDFAGIVLNGTKEQAFTISNTGGTNLHIGTIPTPAAPFSIISDNCSGQTLTPSQTCTLTVTFSPRSQGMFSGTISIPSNAATSSVALSGVGYGLNVWINRVNSASCPTIGIDVTITNPANPNLILNTLTRDQFTLKQNGVTQTITSFANVSPDSVSLVLALDLSASLTAVLGDIQNAGIAFIDQLRSTDEAAICRFKDAVELYPASPPPYFVATDVSGRSAIAYYINSAFDVPGGTALYDALYQSIDTAYRGAYTKRAVVVLSDGHEEHAAGRTLQEVIDNATAKAIPVFTVFYVDPAYASEARTDIMQQLATATGGQYYNSATYSNLAGIFTQIASVLSNRYSISYSASSCSGPLPLEVRADWTGGLYGVDSRTIVP